MASIDDFVNHRWDDAKEALRELDPAYANNFESTVKLQELGLESPWSADVEEAPRKR